MHNILLIGDIHGKINEYWKILQKHNGESIQVGDFGFKKQHCWHLDNIDNAKHKICFGNHDDYTFLNEAHSLNNYSYRSKESLMTIRGAWSIDKAYRIENVSWWANEEMNYNEMKDAIDFYCKTKPRIIVSHECPQKIRNMLFGIQEKSITTNGMQSMLESHQPDLWIFGHHHESRNELIAGTRFICLNELETYLI
jgi:predicted phosphodiesterase